ncbi:hypothetical protein AcV7_001001 [Taiwanofungus camphoratus]|nr:hypothetical protein AcV7_001001 [Antrodia cinnamomea]
MPPNYHHQSFWENRFKNESHFEWLGNGECILRHLRAYMQSRDDHRLVQNLNKPPRLLHIGAGTSSLSDQVLETYQELYQEKLEGDMIVNVDFSETVVWKRSQEETVRQREGRGQGMRWTQADMLRWSDVAELVNSGDGGYDAENARAEEQFAVVLDKSTSDAISCGDDLLFKDLTPQVHPVLQAYLAARPESAITLDPIELLALHLASIVHPGGVWIALSFSAVRFSFLQAQEAAGLGTLERVFPALYWTLQEVESLEAPSGQEKAGVFAPAVRHYLYVMRRTEVSVQ